MEKDLLACTNKKNNLEFLSGHVINETYRNLGTVGTIILVAFFIGFLIWGIVTQLIILICFGVSSLILPLTGIKGRVLACSQFYMDTHLIKIFCNHTKFVRCFQWKDVLTIKTSTCRFPTGGPTYAEEEYLVIATGEYRDDYDFKSVVRYLKFKNVICIPKTDETVSFVEQFKQIEKESE